MTSDEMIANFLKTNKVTVLDESNHIGSENLRLRSKSYHNNSDYRTEAMWDGLVVHDTVSGKEFTFKVVFNKVDVKNRRGKMAVTKFYNAIANCSDDTGNQNGTKMRENTITERISSKRYTIIKKVLG